jgi:hypothetical protein
VAKELTRYNLDILSVQVDSRYKGDRERAGDFTITHGKENICN